MLQRQIPFLQLTALLRDGLLQGCNGLLVALFEFFLLDAFGEGRQLLLLLIDNFLQPFHVGLFVGSALLSATLIFHAIVIIEAIPLCQATPLQ